MALAAAAIKAHFKETGGSDVGVVSSSASEATKRAKAQEMFQSSSEQVYGSNTDNSNLPRQRASLDSQLVGVESVLLMQNAQDSKGDSGEGGGSDSLGMKQKQAIIGAMFAARNSPRKESKGEMDSNSVDDTISDFSEGEDNEDNEVGRDSVVVEDAEEVVEAEMKEEEEEEADQGLPSVPDQRVLAIVNSFVVNATKLINRVCVLTTKQLGDIDRGIHKLQVTLTLLEKKLKSVDGLELGQVAPATTTSSEGRAAGEGGPTDITSTATEVPTAATVEAEKDEEEEEEESQQERAVNSNLVKANEHETYSKYFKMVKMGVIELAVKQKMQAEGLDPSILDKGPDTLIER